MPLLFIIYINNMPNIVKHRKILLNADDALLYYSSKSTSDIEKYVNKDLNLISQWLDQNLLTLNCKKSKFILFGSNSHVKSFTNISIHVNEHQLARERTFKYLGITFSENLSWSDHLNISTKINQRIGLLRRNKAFIPLKTRLIIYNALILPLFDYGDVIWGDKNNSSLMDKLQVLQNKAAKTILDAPYLSSSTEALNKLHWHPLTHRRKLLNNLTEFNLELPKTNHLYNTRRRDDIYLCKPKTNWGKQKLIYQACKEYNDLDYNTRPIEQLGTFRNELLKSLSL